MVIVKLKLKQPVWMRLHSLLERVDITPLAEDHLLVCGIAEELAEKIRKKAFGASAQSTLKLKQYQAIALRNYLLWVDAMIIGIDTRNLIYQTVNALETQFTFKQINPEPSTDYVTIKIAGTPKTTPTL